MVVGVFGVEDCSDFDDMERRLGGCWLGRWRRL